MFEYLSTIICLYYYLYFIYLTKNTLYTSNYLRFRVKMLNDNIKVELFIEIYIYEQII